MHWRALLESDVIRYVDLDGKEYTLRIAAIKRGKVVGTGGKSTGKAMISFEGREKPLAAGTAVLSQIAALYGNDTKAWVGKAVTIYGDPTIKYGGQAVGGVRVKAPVGEPITAPAKAAAQ
jgi:hypothetical protein